MTGDEMEAESGKYSDRVLILLPLSSGLVAVFSNERRLQAIVPWLDVPNVTVTCAPTTEARTFQLNLKDLGL